MPSAKKAERKKDRNELFGVCAVEGLPLVALIKQERVEAGQAEEVRNKKKGSRENGEEGTGGEEQLSISLLELKETKIKPKKICRVGKRRTGYRKTAERPDGSGRDAQ